MILLRVYYWVKFNRLQNSLINVLIRNLTTDLWLACPNHKMLQCRKFGITGLKSSLRVTEKYADCLVYLHFIWRYGFPKLNATSNFTIKQRLKRKYRAKFLKCMFLQAELERGSKELNLMCYWSKFQLWLRPLRNFAFGLATVMNHLMYIVRTLTPHVSYIGPMVLIPGMN